jgi:two-component system response regulator DegU
MTLLIVEDNPTVRKLIRRAAADVASTIVECGDGAESLLAYETNQPDVVLMDVRMPKMDGLTATRLLIRHHPTARVVILTDYDDDEVRSAAREAGACSYALKNNLTELDEILVAVHNRRPAGNGLWISA